MSIPAHMRALEVTSPDGPRSVHLVERPLPKPAPGEVLIKVGAAGVNFADTMQTHGAYPYGAKPPYIAGFEVCGEVVALGEGDSPYPIGAKVIGLTAGAFAEYATAAAAILRPLPKGWSQAQGAALFTSWFTAYGCLRLFGHLAAGESVLIHAAAGGVGQAAVRLAKHFGARVFATASTAEKLKFASDWGADECINYTEQDFVTEVKARTNGRGVDLVLESVGGETFHKSFEAVVPCGRIVVFGIASGEKAGIDNYRLIFEYPIALIGFNAYFVLGKRPDIFKPMNDEFSALIEAGVVCPDEPTAYPLAEGAKVLSALERRETKGKLVLVP